MSKQAFDAVAGAYDAEFTETAVGRLQRERVYEVLRKIIRSSSINQVLELNCGTGADAVWLAQQGCRVLATDASNEMVKVSRKKVKKHQLGSLVECRKLKIQEITDLPETDLFDLVFSNFGGFNCLSPEAVEKVAGTLERRLRPGGQLVLVIMPRFCWWESLYFLAKGRWKQAWRRGGENPVKAPLGNGHFIDTWYYTPAQLHQYFKSGFKLEHIRPVGFFVPPSYLNPAFGNRKRLLRILNQLEASLPDRELWSRGADHFLLHLVKRS